MNKSSNFIARIGGFYNPDSYRATRDILVPCIIPCHHLQWTRHGNHGQHLCRAFGVGPLSQIRFFGGEQEVCVPKEGVKATPPPTAPPVPPAAPPPGLMACKIAIMPPDFSPIWFRPITSVPCVVLPTRRSWPSGLSALTAVFWVAGAATRLTFRSRPPLPQACL